jgi:RNA polymerase sigma factor (sigma-70 family)
MARLDEREQLVLRWYFFKGLRLVEIAKKLHVSEPRACQIKTAAVKKLTARIGATGLIP